jgi:hypothetical protein
MVRLRGLRTPGFLKTPTRKTPDVSPTSAIAEKGFEMAENASILDCSDDTWERGFAGPLKKAGQKGPIADSLGSGFQERSAQKPGGFVERGVDLTRSHGPRGSVV